MSIKPQNPPKPAKAAMAAAARATSENLNERKRLAMRIVGSALSGALLSVKCP